MLAAQFELDVGGQLGRAKLIFMSDHQSTLRAEFSHLQNTMGGRVINFLKILSSYLLFALQTQYFYFPPSSREGNSYCQMKTPRFSFLGKSVWEKVQSREGKVEGNFLKYNFAAKLAWLVEPVAPCRYTNGHVCTLPCLTMYLTLRCKFVFFIFSSVLLICVRIPYLPDLGGRSYGQFDRRATESLSGS